jgi:hypothetical protein
VLDALPDRERAAIAAVVAVDQRPAHQLPEGGAASPTPGLVVGPAKTAATGDYAVQVGAFHDPGLARQAAHSAAALVPQILLLGDIEVSPLQGRRKIVYRARVGGFDRYLADQACGLLQAQRRECFVIRTGPRELAADNTS